MRWSLQWIAQNPGVLRETACGYLTAAGIAAERPASWKIRLQLPATYLHRTPNSNILQQWQLFLILNRSEMTTGPWKVVTATLATGNCAPLRK
jgi:hypothetical protein